MPVRHILLYFVLFCFLLLLCVSVCVCVCMRCGCLCDSDGRHGSVAPSHVSVSMNCLTVTTVNSDSFRLRLNRPSFFSDPYAHIGENTDICVRACVCACVCVCLSVNAKRKKKKTFKEKRRNVKALKLGKWHMNATDEAEHLTTFFFLSRHECLHIKSLHVTVKRHRCSLEGGHHSVVLSSTQLERLLKPT